MIKTCFKVFTFCLSLFFLPLANSTPPTPVAAKHGMVVSEQLLASQIGADILRAGGNAVDAAVAVGYALAVVDPCCGNIGGGGFMTIHLKNGHAIFLNFREKAPVNATKNMYLDKQGNVKPGLTTTGYLAVAVPGTVLGLDTALAHYGTMKREQVMAPAIRLAEQGYKLSAYQIDQFQPFLADFRSQPNVAAIFLKQGEPYHAGDVLVQKELAHTLTLIAKQGPRAFYAGPIANKIVEASKQQGGILSLQDFKHYDVEFMTPIQCHYRGYDIISAPPPSSGGVTLCEILNILKDFPLKTSGYHTAESLHYIIEAMRYGFRDRNNQLGDPDYVTDPVRKLISDRYSKSIDKKIKASPTPPTSKPITTRHELTDTTHYSVVDDKGNAVSVTYTLNGFFGARVMAGDTGFFLNDEMDDFAAKAGTENKFGLVQSDANNIAPGKRPLSSMTPTIVLKKGHVFLVLGSPGGPRIITAVLLTLSNVIDYDMLLQAAIDAPRFHYQGDPDEIDIEPNALSDDVIAKLTRLGYRVTPQHTWAAVEGIMVNPENGLLY